MSKKQFHKLILHFVLTLAAIVVLLIQQLSLSASHSPPHIIQFSFAKKSGSPIIRVNIKAVASYSIGMLRAPREISAAEYK